VSTAPRVSTTAVHCHGQRKGGRGEGQCERFLGYVPGRFRFLLVTDRAPDLPDGRLWTQCKDCKQWNVFVTVTE
jgi:hypothetical protein